MLHAEGLIEAAPGRGQIVTVLKISQAEQLFYMREAVEGMAARLAAMNVTADQVEEMSVLLTREAELQDSSPEELLALNDKFHAVIYRAAKNQYVLKAMDNYSPSMVLLRSMNQREVYAICKCASAPFSDFRRHHE